MDFMNDKRILITGVCGTVGSALARILLEDPRYSPAEVIGIDNNESELFFIEQLYISEPRAKFFLADLRDRDTLQAKMHGVDIVYHAAALKHVVICERSPYEAVQTNIHGVQNVIHAAKNGGVEKVIFTSSDKAVNPTNVMGTSKLMGERLMTAANSNQIEHGPVFTSTRFGNVLGSNGSVIPIFHKQIAKGGPVTLTHPDMTRFVMSIEDAVQLVINSAAIAQGGEVFVTKMPAIFIRDLAEVMIEELASVYGYAARDIEIRQIGAKPGEKLYEELLSAEETRRSVELDHYFSILPAFRSIYRNIPYDYKDIVREAIDHAYISSSEPPLTKVALRSFLNDNNLLSGEGMFMRHPDARYWPGDKE